jgi:hypothetical protein
MHLCLTTKTQNGVSKNDFRGRHCSFVQYFLGFDLNHRQISMRLLSVLRIFGFIWIFRSNIEKCGNAT